MLHCPHLTLIFHSFPLPHDHFPHGTMAPQRRPSTRYDALSSINSYQRSPSSRKPHPVTESTSDRVAAKNTAFAESECAKPHTISSSSAPIRASMSCGIQLPRLFYPRRHIAPRHEQRNHLPSGYRRLNLSTWDAYPR